MIQTKLFSVTTLSLATLFACKPIGRSSKVLTHPEIDHFIRVAVKHIGKNCEDSAAADPSHYLNGSHGNLTLEENRNSDSYGFSGDRVIGRTSVEVITKMEDIEKKCRRLILSIDIKDVVSDSHFYDGVPEITFANGSSPANQKEKFKKDFGKNGFGEVRCEFDHFCTFSNIKGNTGGPRYFAYLEPDNATKMIKAYLKIISETGRIKYRDDHDVFPLPNKDHHALYRGSITLKGIYREKR